MSKESLCWNVFIESNSKILIYNIFNHDFFMNDLFNLKKQLKKEGKEDDFATFEDSVKRSLMYFYWSKFEWEIVLTSFPPYIDSEELDRLVKERDERLKKYENFYRECTNLECYKKVDVYSQINLNWNQFINYLWENRKLIKKVK